MERFMELSNRSRKLGQCGCTLLLIWCLNTPTVVAQQISNERSRTLNFDTFGQSWQGREWLGGAAESRQWRLGVTGDNTNTGVLVREVTANSAAARARIETGDLILNVAGYQVGLVNGRLYDLAEEINRRADASGNISLIVQDHRTARLSAVQIRLDAHQSLLSGRLINRERSPLPSDAIVTIQIENVSRPYYTVRNGQTSFRPPLTGNIPFELAYDPTYINAQDIYRVSAFVTTGGRTILDTPQPQRVITSGNPSQVELRLEPLSGSSAGGTVSVGYSNYNELDDRLIALYRRYLKRNPTAIELAALHATPGISNRLDTLPLDILGGQEYFDAAGNNNVVWLEKVFAEIVQRRASAQELEQWMQRYAQLRFSRTELLRQLYAQASK